MRVRALLECRGAIPPRCRKALMLRLLLLLLLALPLSGRAATISSTTCPGSGCITTYLGNISATAISLQVTGTWVGTIAFEGSNDGTTYLPLLGQTTTTPAVYTSTTTANGRWLIPALGALYVRVRASAWTSGSATVLPQPTSSAALLESVAVSTPDGGLPVTLGEQRVSVEATGLAGGPVGISGTVDLGTNTLNTLTPNRTRRDWRGMPVDGGAPTPVPYALPDGGMPPLDNRTEVSISYAQNGGSARCGCPEVGEPLPSCDAAPIRYAGKTLSSGVTVTWSELKTGTTCYCVGCGLTGTDTRQVEVLEGGNAP